MSRWLLGTAPRAEEDIIEIWGYIAQDNEPAADRLLRAIVELFEKTADFPRLGRGQPWLPADHRILSHGKYLLIYQVREAEHQVELVRVLHGARNAPALFRDLP